METIDNSVAAPVYDFYEIDKCFPPTSPTENVMAGKEQRLIPIYICKPLRQVVAKMTPLQIQQAEVLKELTRIDEMEIKVSLAPLRVKSSHSRKTRLIPLGFVSNLEKEAGEQKEHLVEKDVELGTENMQEEEEEEKSDSGVELIKQVTPVDDLPPNSSSPVRPESPERPQFQCDRCEKSFYLKRAMLRHLYSHK